MKLVRLYPRDPRRGWFIKTYVNVELELKILGDRGWYLVEDNIAEKLAKVRQKKYDPHSKLAFMIANDKEEAAKMDLMLEDPEEEQKRIGTADYPVQMKKRPGVKSKETGSKKTFPKSRKRRSATQRSKF
jgi:hypothetical protein